MPRRRRTTDIDVKFDEYGWAIGWHFKLHEAFKTALDIRYTPRTDKATKEVIYEWTRGQPPAFEFTVGDVAHADGVTVQIQQSTAVPDEDNDNVTLLVRFFRPNHEPTDLRMDQPTFADMLQTGHIDGRLLVAALAQNHQ